MGAVTDSVRALVPGSYRAMVDVTNPYYGPDELQALADYVKLKLTGTIVNANAEASVYDKRLVMFFGKVTTLQFIPAAVDFWGDQLIGETATGTNESRTYPDRRDGLWKYFEKLRAEVVQEFDELAPIYGFIIYGSSGMVPKVTYGDNGRRILITPDPQEFEPPYGEANSNWPSPIWTLNS